MKIKVAIAGARGRMGTTAIEAIEEAIDAEVVAALDYKYGGLHLHNSSVNDGKHGIPIYTSLADLVAEHQPAVLLDVTDPDAVFKNVKEALELGIHPVVGTSGLTKQELDEISMMVESTGIGGIIAPNFSIGAVLMMKFAAQAARYLGDVEILEMHHDRKLDAPSGTAVKTAEMIKENRPPHIQGHPEEQIHLEGARGGDVEGMKIHSIRLPGLLAHQQVLLGGEGELLTIRHDSLSRKSFMPGIMMAIRKVVGRNDLIYGLEHIID
ncbi:4-hydroxy-tetrahydrodipicolinate reductase [Sporosarcina highlanderae]|uniref:4-hydroxy-tetrahydrodipicolinate reductase n=1 Tax=Sporosarcina highlanderae TaxID=3035916 RepID=A0ABT8JUH8_9BACL|nr:4-hydroxy-tetrahydrodipicolinate reductase [Sporosarcina highlanderae]MDN4608719.1 4-hydroxy-tetrahydrodipicolinate reductase [Sporosarcina highlanderae]